MGDPRLSTFITSIPANFPEVSLVYLFGSQVTGQVGPMSDYDLAVLLDSLADSEEIQNQLSHELALSLGTDLVEVVVLNHAPVELAYHVIAQGIPLYQRDVATRVEYEARVLGLYGDYLPVLRDQRRQILQGDANAKRVQRYRTAFRRTQRALSPPSSSTR